MSDDVLLIDGDCNFCNSIARWIDKNKSESKTIEIIPLIESKITNNYLLISSDDTVFRSYNSIFIDDYILGY